MRTGRRWWRVAGIGLASVLGLVIIGAGSLAARLAAGPIDLSGYANEITAGVASALGSGHTATLGGVELAWDDGVPQVTVTDLAVRTQDGTLVAAAPRGYVGLSLRALLLGRIEPVSLRARSPLVALTQFADGSFGLGGPDPRMERGRTTSALALLDPDAIARTLGRAQPMDGQALSLLLLSEVTVTIREDVTGLVRTLEPFDLSLRQRGDALIARFAEGGRGRWWFLASLTRQDGAQTLSIETRGVSGQALGGAEAGGLGGLVVGAELLGRLGPTGGLEAMTGTIELSGTGYLEGPGWSARVAPARLQVSFDPVQRSLAVAPSAIALGPVSGLLAGRVVMPAPGDPTKLVRGQVSLEQIRLDDGGPPLPELNRIVGSFAFESTSRVLYLDQIEGFGERSSGAARGQLNFVGPTPGLVLDAVLQGISAESARRVWPHFIAPEAQEWFLANVRAGQLERAQIALRVPPGWLDGRNLAREMFTAEWRIRDATVVAAPELPPVTGLNGVIRTTGTSVHVEAADGVLRVPSGDVRVPTVSFRSDDMDRPRAVGQLRARAVGLAGALLDLGDRQGLPLAKGGGFDPRTLSGDGVANIEFTFPIRPDQGQPVLRTTVDLTNVAGKGVFEGRDLERGTFRIETDGAGFQADGTATVGGVPVKLAARREGEKVILRAELETDDAQRTRFGLNLAPMLTGPATVRLVRELSGNDTLRRLEIDMTQARIALPEAAFEKARGVPATFAAVLRVRERERLVGLDDIQLQGRGFSARGRVRLGDDNQPNLIEFSEVRLRPDDQFAVRVERGEGRQSVRVTGRSIDLRPFLRNLLADEDDPASGDRIELSVRVDRAIGQNAVPLTDMRLDLTRVGQRLSEVKLTGSFGGATRVVGEVLTDEGRPYLRLISTDGGAALRFLDLYKNVRGGNLTITQTLTDPTGRRATGVVLLDNFRVVDDQGLERLFGAAPQDPEGSLRRVRGNDVIFDRMRVVFVRAPGSMTLSEGVLRNLNVGMTFEGAVDFRRQQVNLRGVFVPAFALNNFLARIPIVGMFMGGQNEGLIGITYQVAGPMSGPTLQINPASAIAPGFLRHIFAFRDGASSGAPPRSPAAGRPDSSN